jgi:formylmethanofuran dehydrogenase subunit E
MLEKASEKLFNNVKPFSDVIKFHGHVCPGSALGYLAAQAGLRELYSSRSSDVEIVVVVENDTCAVDALQVVTGCTMGKGNLIFHDYGKQAYIFIERKSGDGVRVSLKNSFDMNKLEPELAPLRQKVALGMASEEEKEELGKLMEKVSKITGSYSRVSIRN